MNSNSASSVTCNCDCDKCKRCQQNNVWNNPMFEGIIPFVNAQPADYLAIDSLSNNLLTIIQLYKYLLSVPQEQFDEPEARKKYEEFEDLYNKFSQSFVYYTFNSNDNISKITDTWKIYLDKSYQLLLMRSNPRTAVLFPISGENDFISNLL